MVQIYMYIYSDNFSYSVCVHTDIITHTRNLKCRLEKISQLLACGDVSTCTVAFDKTIKSIVPPTPLSISCSPSLYIILAPCFSFLFLL